MIFRKYSEIENSSRRKTLDDIIERNLDQGEFVLQEKAHGANLSFWFDGAAMKSAKRTGFIEADDNFYNFNHVAENNRDRVIRLYDLLKAEGREFEVLTVFGELIGGSYPHPDVPADKTAVKIQKGIFYTPHNEFYAIDVALNGQLLDIDTFTRVMEAVGFLYARTIFRGTFQQCLEHPNDFQSRIADWLGLPEIANNNCEGVVIKPVHPLFLTDRDRLILKNKNAVWQEKAQKKKRGKKPQTEVRLSSECRRLIQEMASLITENRLRNVISKIGQVGQKDFGILLRDYSADILAEFQKDFKEPYEALDKSERKAITQFLNKKGAETIRNNFQNIIDGEF